MTRLRRFGLLAISVLAPAAGLLAGCGGPDEQERAAAQILQQTFRSSSSVVDDGYLSLSVRLDPTGPLAARGPLVLTVLGPFSRSPVGDRGRFAVELAARVAEQQYVATVLATGERSFVTLDGRTYELEDGLRAPPEAQHRHRLAVTGFDPLRWISGARIKRSERAVGVRTARVGGEVNVERLLEDLDRLWGRAGGSPRSVLLSRTLRRQIAGAVRSSWIDIWTGAADRALRQVSVRFEFSFGDESPLQALTGGKLNLHLRLDDVNERVAPASTFAAPRDLAARGGSELPGGSAADVVERLGAGLTGRSPGVLACLDRAKGSSASLMRCVARVAP